MSNNPCSPYPMDRMTFPSTLTPTSTTGTDLQLSKPFATKNIIKLSVWFINKEKILLSRDLTISFSFEQRFSYNYTLCY